MTKRIFALMALLAAVTLLSSGCGGKKTPDGMPELYPVSVTVTQGGQPVEGVALTCFNDTLGYGVSGLSDSSGVVKLVTSGEYPGAPAAEYKVTAWKYEFTPSQCGKCPIGGDARAEWEEKYANEYRPAYNYVDPALADKTTTTLTLTVEKGTKTAALDLGEAVKVEIDEKTKLPIEK